MEYKSKQIENCAECEKPTDKTEMLQNSKWSTSGYREICNKCIKRIQQYIDFYIDGRE